MAGISYPRYSYSQIQSAAAAFLGKYNPGGTVPVPIEEIIEFQLGIDIVPMPGLHQAFDTDGFTTSDLTAIYVEEYVYRNVSTRYRFTLSHEIGHVVLHKSFYSSLGWKNVAEWKKTIQKIPDDQYQWLEWHANTFAGLVLIPDSELEAQIKKCKQEIDRILPKPMVEPDAYQDFLAECLGQAFEVSPEAAGRRLKKWNELNRR